jgi:LmbE family N-acetylglucosaminyl deacetylase
MGGFLLQKFNTQSMKLSERDLALFVHPDDNEWVAGGTTALQTSLGRNIDQILVTGGAYKADERVKTTRRLEQRRAMDILGMKVLHPLDFPDGMLTEDMFGEITTSVLHIIDNARSVGVVIDTIYSFGPDGYTGHDDHKMVARVAEEIFRRRPVRRLLRVRISPEERMLWPDDWPLGEKRILVPRANIFDCMPVDISGTIYQKMEGIATHTSQLLGDNGGLVQIDRVSRTPRIEYFDVWER